MLIDTITKHFREMLNKYPNGLSNTSTKKFDTIRNDLADEFQIDVNDVYAVGAGNRAGNLEVRLCQGERATMHTILGVGFMYDSQNTEENRKKLTNSAFVTLTKMLNRGKASYEMVLLMIQNPDAEVFPTGLIYAKETELTNKIKETFSLNSEMMHQIELSTDSSTNGLVPSVGLENIILYGPPGTSKTYALQHDFNVSSKNSSVVTFHQAYSYEEFVEGIKPKINSENLVYEISKGIFFKSCEEAAKAANYKSLEDCILDTKSNRHLKLKKAVEEGKIFTFCIDEINRANIAGVFGDLISLIEISKRLGNEDELCVNLPYSKELFGVPANLKIIGTMNTADRSITLLDSALRRRFSFIEMPPLYDKLPVIGNNDDEINISRLLYVINKRITFFLGKDFCIGHTYFLNVKNKKDLLHVFLNKILPLLEEYFYNESYKIKLILSESNSDQQGFYTLDTEATLSYLFPNEIEENIEDRVVYKKNEEIIALLDDDVLDTDIDSSIFTRIYNIE